MTVSLASGLYLVQKRQITNTEASGIALTLSTSNANPNMGDNVVVAVGIDTKGLSVSASDLRIKYDPNILEAQEIKTTGDFLPTVLIPGSIDSSSGLAKIILGCLVIESGAYPKSGISAIAQISFTVKASGTTEVSFDPGTQVAALGQTTDVTDTKTPVQINVAGATVPPAVETIPPTAPATIPPAVETTPPSSTTAQGDVNLDGSVNLLDIGLIINHYGRPAEEYPQADVDGSGTINLIDLGIVINNYNR